MYYKDRKKEDLQENFSNSMYNAKQTATEEKNARMKALFIFIGCAFTGFISVAIIFKILNKRYNPVYNMYGMVIGMAIGIMLAIIFLQNNNSKY
jgi:hypothetical protein